MKKSSKKIFAFFLSAAVALLASGGGVSAKMENKNYVMALVSKEQATEIETKTDAGAKEVTKTETGKQTDETTKADVGTKNETGTTGGTGTKIDTGEKIDTGTKNDTGTRTEVEKEAETESENQAEDTVTLEQISWDDSWEFADHSEVHEDSITLYRAPEKIRNGYVVAVNAGHGSSTAAQVQTLCHPDGTAKVTSGSTGEGAIYATGANCGTELLDGTAEADAVLELAELLKEELLARGYDVLMLRDAQDCNMDNIARTVYANNNADCHIALHYDSSDYDKGMYYTGVPEIDSYRAMYPVSEHWQEHELLGQSLIQGASAAGVKIFDSGTLGVDLTQTSYSTVPSVDLEVGDRGSDHSRETLDKLVKGIADGLGIFFGQEEDEKGTGSVQKEK